MIGRLLELLVRVGVVVIGLVVGFTGAVLMALGCVGAAVMTNHPDATALVMRGIGGDQNAVFALPGSTSNMTKERPLRPGEVATEQAHEEEPE